MKTKFIQGIKLLGMDKNGLQAVERKAHKYCNPFGKPTGPPFGAAGLTKNRPKP